MSLSSRNRGGLLNLGWNSVPIFAKFRTTSCAFRASPLKHGKLVKGIFYIRVESDFRIIFNGCAKENQEEEEELRAPFWPGVDGESVCIRPHFKTASILEVASSTTNPRWRVNPIEGGRGRMGGGR